MQAKLEVNVDNIVHNIETIRKDKDALIAVKANAYGMGIKLIDHLVDRGYDFFGVSTVDEAVYIKERFPDTRVLIFSGVFPEDLEIVHKYNIMITVYDFEMLNLMTNEDSFHIKVDVGMGRLGFQEEELDGVIKILRTNKVEATGFYSHLPMADNDEVTEEQIKKFQRMLEKFQEYQKVRYVHLYSSLAALKYESTFDNVVRLGLLAYGYYGSAEIKNRYNEDIRESARLSARVSHLKNYHDKIGYDLTEKVDGKVATVTMGYHDGLNQGYRHLSIAGVGEIVGKVCMCQTMVKLEEDKNNKIKKGEYIEIFGDNTSIYDVAKHTKTSVYELLSVLSDRVKRIYY